MSVYDWLSDSVIITREGTAETILYIFKVADEILISLMEKFSGRHIEFGKIVFENTGERVGYSVTIDEEQAGENIEEIPHALSGRLNVVVYQERVLGEYVLFDRKISVPAHSTATVEFAIPYLTPREIAAFNLIDRTIWENWYKPDAEAKIKEAFSQAKILTLDGETGAGRLTGDLKVGTGID